MRIVRSNKRNIRKRLSKAFKMSVQSASNKNREVINTPRSWQGFSDTRDIVDLGNLRDSQKLEFTGENTASISWDGNGITPVQVVYFGHRTPTSYVAGRQWDKVAEAEQPFAFTFVQYFKNIN